MSYYIKERDSYCVIPASNIPQACKRLYEMMKEYEDEVELKQPSVDWLRDLLGRLDFEVIPQQNCTEIYFAGDRYSEDIETTLDTIAPCVKDGSYFEVEGEDGAMWRWVLKNGKCHEIIPEIIWPNV